MCTHTYREGCSDQTVTTAMLTHWKYTRKEMLSLVLVHHYTYIISVEVE